MDVRLPDGTMLQNVPDGTSKADLMIKLERNGYDMTKLTVAAEPKQPSKPFGEQLNSEIANIPRQIGLTARHGLNGVGNLVGMFSDPIGGVINAATGSKLKTARSMTGMLSDAIGLPKPETAVERGVGDASEMMATGGGMIGAAGKAANSTVGMGKVVSKALASNPLQQVVSAGSAGGAGGYVRETGGDDVSQFAAALATGLATPYAMGKVQQGASAVGRLTQRAPDAPQMAQIDIQINNALQPNGMTLGDLPAAMQAGIRADVAQALKTNGSLSPDAVRRAADYRLTGTTPTAATLTLDPAMVSQQKNLAKLGINSKDVAAQQLGLVENANNRQLITGLNTMGANTADDALAGGQKIMGALDARNTAAKSAIDARYTAARETTGRSAALDPHAFTNQANNLLDDALVGGKLPADVRGLLNKTAAGEMPLTVDVAEQLKTRIGDLQRKSMDGAERKALGLVRQALDDTPLLDGQGQQAIDAFNKARKLNRAWMGIVEKTPALQAVRDGIEPDKFVQQFVVGGGSKANLADLEALKRSVKSSPEAMGAIKEQIAAHLKKQAINGAADEVGNFSQSAYNKSLNAIGEKKLGMFFNSEELNQLKAIGRVASYDQFQPKGSAVNNSNTAGTAISNILDRIGGSSVLSKIPFGNALAGPAQNISVGMRAKQAMDVPNALVGNALTKPMPRQSSPLLLAPTAIIGGNDRENRNSLFPRR